MKNIFITGTGTDIGKTYVTHSLLTYDRIRAQKWAALKPLVSGLSLDNMAQSDTGLLLSAMGMEITLDNINKISPWRYQTPAAPDIAQRIENQKFNFAELVDFCNQETKKANQKKQQMIIEGVGGVMSPISEAYTVLDWIKTLSMPTLIIAGTYLGSITHTLTCLSVLQENKIPVVGIVLNETQNSSISIEDTKRSLRQYTQVPVFTYYYQQSSDVFVRDLYKHLTSVYWHLGTMCLMA